MPAKDDQNVTIEEFFEYLKTYLDEKQIALVRKAYEFAAKKHADQKRRSGEPYIIHPTQVANILARMKMDEETLAAAFLHDVVEDTDTTLQQLKEMFGTKVAMLVDGVTKLGKIEYISKEERQIENYRKITAVYFQGNAGNLCAPGQPFGHLYHKMGTGRHGLPISGSGTLLQSGRAGQDETKRTGSHDQRCHGDSPPGTGPG